MAQFDIVAVAKTILRSVGTTFPVFGPYVNVWNEHEAVETTRSYDQKLWMTTRQ